jgi:hypothetical protein
MRRMPVAGGLALVLALGGGAAAEPVPYTAPVTAGEVEVRAGPSTDPKFYPTNRLPRGASVQVLKERADGWLEIRPPDGSFSWINTRYVSQMVPTMPNNFVVVTQTGEKAPVLVGTELGEGKPTVVGSMLERSTQVRRYLKAGVPGASMSDADGTWMPIEPPPAEVRYLRAEAVQKAAPAPPAVASLPSAPQAFGGSPVGSATSSFTPATAPQAAAPAPGDKPTHAEVEETYNRAVMAERGGNIALAAQLYAKAGSQGLAINSPVAPQAIGRANYLLGNAPPAAPTPATNNYAPLPAADAAAGVRLSRPYPPTPVAPAGATFTTSRQAAEVAAAGGLQFVGQLRRSGRGKNNRPTYVLEVARGPYLYANPGPGVDLDPYVGRNVELIGAALYDGELRANYMTVTQVRPVQ